MNIIEKIDSDIVDKIYRSYHREKYYVYDICVKYSESLSESSLQTHYLMEYISLHMPELYKKLNYGDILNNTFNVHNSYMGNYHIVLPYNKENGTKVLMNISNMILYDRELPSQIIGFLPPYIPGFLLNCDIYGKYCKQAFDLKYLINLNWNFIHFESLKYEMAKTVYMGESYFIFCQKNISIIDNYEKWLLPDYQPYLYGDIYLSNNIVTLLKYIFCLINLENDSKFKRFFNFKKSLNSSPEYILLENELKKYDKIIFLRYFPIKIEKKSDFVIDSVNNSDDEGTIID